MLLEMIFCKKVQFLFCFVLKTQHKLLGFYVFISETCAIQNEPVCISSNTFQTIMEFFLVYMKEL